MNKPIRYDLVKAKIKRARAGSEELKSFHMREVDGRDEEVAAGAAKARGGQATTQEELVRVAIVGVNDRAVKQPYLQFDTWNARARAFALQAFREINGMTQDEDDAFKATGEESDAPPPSAASSASGTE